MLKPENRFLYKKVYVKIYEIPIEGRKDIVHMIFLIYDKIKIIYNLVNNFKLKIIFSIDNSFNNLSC